MMTISKLYNKVCCLFAKVGVLEGQVSLLTGGVTGVTAVSLDYSTIPEYATHTAADAALAIGSPYFLPSDHALYITR